MASKSACPLSTSSIISMLLNELTIEEVNHRLKLLIEKYQEFVMEEQKKFNNKLSILNDLLKFI